MLIRLGLGPQESLTTLFEIGSPYLINFVSTLLCPLGALLALEDTSACLFCLYMPSLLQYKMYGLELRVFDLGLCWSD